MGLIFKNIKELYTIKPVSCKTELHSKVLNKDIKLTRKSKQI